MERTEDTATTEARRGLEISRRDLEALELHATAAYPEECCGFLLGAPGGPDGGDVWVEETQPAENELPGDRRHGYLIRAEAVLGAMRQARGRGLELVGYYHSHPDHPAEPSPTDLESAWPGVSYLIVPVTAVGSGPARSWRLTADRVGFVEEPVRTFRARPPARAADGARGRLGAAP